MKNKECVKETTPIKQQKTTDGGQWGLQHSKKKSWPFTKCVLVQWKWMSNYTQKYTNEHELKTNNNCVETDQNK